MGLPNVVDLGSFWGAQKKNRSQLLGKNEELS
jgi:hypothetical protein